MSHKQGQTCQSQMFGRKWLYHRDLCRHNKMNVKKNIGSIALQLKPLKPGQWEWHKHFLFFSSPFFLKWDGKTYNEIDIDGETLRFYGKLLLEKYLTIDSFLGSCEKVGYPIWVYIWVPLKLPATSSKDSTIHPRWVLASLMCGIFFVVLFKIQTSNTATTGNG